MGGFFEPDITSVSNVSGPQGQVQGLVSQQLAELLGGRGVNKSYNKALLDLLKGTPTDISALSNATLGRFERDVVPRVNAEFAGLGGSLSSRRSTELTRSRTDLQSQIGALQTGLIESARGRQLQALQQTLGPLQIGAGFSTANTMDQITQPSMFSQLLGLAGTVGSAALLGGIGGPAGLAAGGPAGLAAGLGAGTSGLARNSLGGLGGLGGPLFGQSGGK